jgi:hypothetical protein
MSDRELQLHNISLVFDFIEEVSCDGQEKVIANMLTSTTEKLQSMLDALKWYQIGDRVRIQQDRNIDEHQIDVDVEICVIETLEIMIKNAIYMKSILKA